MDSVAAAVKVLEVSPSQNSLQLIFISLGGISVSPLRAQLQMGGKKLNSVKLNNLPMVMQLFSDMEVRFEG